MGQRNRGADSIRITAPLRGGARGCTLSGGARQIHHGGRAREKSKHESKFIIYNTYILPKHGSTWASNDYWIVIGVLPTLIRIGPGLMGVRPPANTRDPVGRISYHVECILSDGDAT